MTRPVLTREQLTIELPRLLLEHLMLGVEELSVNIHEDIIGNAMSDDHTLSSVSSIHQDPAGNIVVRTFSGDLFLYRVKLEAL